MAGSPLSKEKVFSRRSRSLSAVSRK
ncbi:hypothetical protein A2U01_0115611, partial [Trifolium medium]|nr:hypothetical protein [Trifolium medium]